MATGLPARVTANASGDSAPALSAPAVRVTRRPSTSAVRSGAGSSRDRTGPATAASPGGGGAGAAAGGRAPPPAGGEVGEHAVRAGVAQGDRDRPASVGRLGGVQ